MSMATSRSTDMISANNPNHGQLGNDQQDYHRGLRSDMQLHDPHRHPYSLGSHAQGTGPYPLHLTGVQGGIDMRQRDSGAAAALLHHSSAGASSSSRSSSNMGMMSASSSGPGSAREGYPDVAVARQCEREGCTVQPSYGKVWKKPRFCAKHKLPGMMDVRNRRCEEPGCTRQPSYGKEGQRRQFCFTHKREGDVDVKSTRCKSAGCPKHAMYGRPGEMPQYCSAHKAEDMVDVKKRRRCNADGCERRASYALEGEKAAFCSAHKQAGHVNVNNRRCEYHGCSRRPVFSIQGEKPRFCVAHKLDGMSDSRLTAGRGKAGSGRPSQVAAAQQRIYSNQTGGYPGRAGGLGRIGGGGAIGGRMGADSESDMMFAASQAAMMGQGGGAGGKLGGHPSRHSSAQATVSAAAAVIAAMEDEARLDYRGAHGGGGSGAGGGSGGQGDRGLRNGAGFRDSESDMYETLQHGGAVGVTRPKTEVGGWTSALFAADRDGGAWDSSRSSPPPSSMAPSHGHGEVWQSASSSRGLGSAVSAAGPTPGGRDSDPDMYRMSNVTPMGGAGGGSSGGGGGGSGGGGGGSSSHYLDDRSSRGFLNSLTNGGGGNGGDFVSSFASSSGAQNAWHGGGSGGGGGGGGGGSSNSNGNGNGSGMGNEDGGDLQWERSRPRPPPVPAPVPPSWGRAVGVSSSDMHRHGGLLPPPSQQRLPSLLNSRRAPLSNPGMGYGDPHAAVGVDGRESGGFDARSREQG